MSQGALPVGVQVAMTYVGLAITIVCAIAMLKGQNWGRMLYVVWGAIGFVITFVTSPMRAAMLPGLVVFAVIVYFLFRPAANAFFAGSGSGDAASA